MIFFEIALITTTIMASVSAWSTPFHQFFHAFSAPPLPVPFRSFFQQHPLLQQQQQQQQQPYYVHQPQFRQPLQLYQPPPTVRQPTPQSTQAFFPPPDTRQPMTTTDVHHHHHVFYYYYFPDSGELKSITGRTEDRVVRGNQAARRPCNGNPVTESVCPPVYLPPAPPTTPPPPTVTLPPPPPLPSPVPPPCDDDTVVVDNVEYPFGRGPIVVAAATNSATATDNGRGAFKNYGSENSGQQSSRPGKSNFILANYLLPPDK